jgi:hypothetical protein
MVAFSKYALLCDLIVIPILLAVLALPTELIGYIGGYVTPLKATRLKERYENVLGELDNIKRRTEADWAEYAMANFTRLGYKETPKCFKAHSDIVGLWKKDKPEHMRKFHRSFKYILQTQAHKYIWHFTN